MYRHCVFDVFCFIFPHWAKPPARRGRFCPLRWARSRGWNYRPVTASRFCLWGNIKHRSCLRHWGKIWRSWPRPSASANFARFCPVAQATPVFYISSLGKTARPLRVCIFMLWILPTSLGKTVLSWPVALPSEEIILYHRPIPLPPFEVALLAQGELEVPYLQAILRHYAPPDSPVRWHVEGYGGKCPSHHGPSLRQ